MSLSVSSLRKLNSQQRKQNFKQQNNPPWRRQNARLLPQKAPFGVTEDSNNAENESAEKLTSTIDVNTAVISTHPEPITAAAIAPMKSSVVSYLGHALGLVYALNDIFRKMDSPRYSRYMFNVLAQRVISLFVFLSFANTLQTENEQASAEPAPAAATATTRTASPAYRKRL